MIPSDSNSELSDLRRRVAELEFREARYQGLFENSPVSLWEEDFSQIKIYLEQLGLSRADELAAHLDANPGDLVKCVQMVRILDVNKSTLTLCRAESKDQLFAGLSTVFGQETFDTFRHEILALWSGASSFEAETIVYTVHREPKNVLFSISVSERWERAIISLQDITLQKFAEEAHRRSILQVQEETIRIQRDTLARLSTPVIPITDQVMVMPVVGALDPLRVQRMMETLLSAIQGNQARIAILDITGVPEIDAQTANAVVRTAQAVQLLGAQIVLTGIRPDVARCLVELGADLSKIVTSGTLQAGIAYAMRNSSGR